MSKSSVLKVLSSQEEEEQQEEQEEQCRALLEQRSLRETLLKRKKTALLIEVTVPSDFSLNNTEIRITTKYQDPKNEVKII